MKFDTRSDKKVRFGRMKFESSDMKGGIEKERKSENVAPSFPNPISRGIKEDVGRYKEEEISLSAGTPRFEGGLLSLPVRRRGGMPFPLIERAIRP